MTNLSPDPILLDLPTPIYTNRLMLRPPIAGDGPALNQAILDSFEDLHEWMPWATVRPTLEDSEKHVRKWHAKWILREDIQFLIFEKVSGILVGSTGLSRIDWKIPKFEIGYWVRQGFGGKGYITEAVAAATQFSFLMLKANRVEILCDVDNLKSRKIPERLGFQLEGIRKNDRVKPRSLVVGDTCVYVRFDEGGLPDVGLDCHLF